MLCDRCHKKDAKILYTEIINGVKKEQHLCDECAADYTTFQMEKPLLNSDLTLNDLLSTLLEAYNNSNATKRGETKPEIVCDQCHMTFEEFLQKGRFGCANCYRSFHKKLGNTLRGIQGAEVHMGKRPKGYVSTTDRILKDMSEAERLSLKLQEAIEKEEFEEAARLRDLIRQIKKEETNHA
jgi:protein arginine kinase activator